ncbi:MAG: hypothetical protein ABUS79_05540, partial [Pseudomonadota bacterium]
MAKAAPAMAVAQADGRALLTVAGREVGAFFVERLEVEHTGATATTPAQLRNRRGRLLAATLVAPRDRLESRLRELAAEAQADAGADDSGELRLALDQGALTVTAPGAAARAPVVAGPGRTVRVAIEGEGPAADRLRRLLAEVLGPPAGGEPDTHDPLGAALDQLFVAEGFRLPASGGVRLQVALLDGQRVLLRWGAGPAPPASFETTDPGSARELVALREALAASAPGAERAEIAHRLAAACERQGDEDGALGALQACIENAGPGRLAAAAWRRLVELHARRGDPHAAARALIASADDPRAEATEVERAATLVAAAEILRKRLSLPADAGMLLERALALDPACIEALEALEALTAEAGEMGRLAEVLERKLEVAARGPREQTAILARLAELYDGPLGDPERATRTRARLATVDGQPFSTQATAPAADVEQTPRLADPTYWRETSAEAEPAVRANALVAKARVALARGDVGAALTELDAALADVPDHAPSLALAGELAFRRQDWPRARQLYGALERAPAVGDAISHEQLVQRRAALAHRTGELAQAEALYRELAILSPQSVEARRALSELALARGDTTTAAHR